MQKEESVQLSSLAPKYEQDLRDKVTAFTSQRGDFLAKLFDSYSGHTDYVTKDEFRKTVQNEQFGFTEQELTDIIKYICKQNIEGNVNYKHFLGFGNAKFLQIDNELQMRQAQQITHRIFTMIKNSLKQSNLTQEAAFNCFDLNNDGIVSI